MEHYYINDHEVGFDAQTHQYYVDGHKVKSVTQMIGDMLGTPYKRVDPVILEKAAARGNELHDMIEQYERFNKKTYHIEMQGYLALKAQYQIKVLESEKIVLLQHNGIIIAAGRFDMVIESPFMKGLGIVDVKRMAHLHEERLSLQLNLYKLGYEQTYKKRIHYLKCIHIRNRYHDYKDIAVDKRKTIEFIETYLTKFPVTHPVYY